MAIYKTFLRLYATKASLKSVRIPKEPIISCKRPEFNHFEGQTYSKLDGIPLASKGWLHNKSKGDYFIIHANANKQGEGTQSLKQKEFVDLGLKNEIIELLRQQNIHKPTEIQSKAIPAILSGYNNLVTAETGCGKTLAYLLPIIEHMIGWKQFKQSGVFNSPMAIIITPSRELATQIGHVAEVLCQTFNLNTSVLVGGRTKKRMMNPVLEDCDLLVASLGALSKLITTGCYKINNIHHVVLDEGDTLLDDSFIEKLAYLLSKFPFQFKTNITMPPSGCQLTIVSATMPTELPKAISKFIDPESLKTISTANIHKMLPHVPQKFVRLGKAQKPLALLKLVQAEVNLNRPVMIFSNQTKTCDWVSMFLNENNINCVNLTGEMSVLIKSGKFDLFRSGKCNVLSCTDIASRGLDTVRTKHVLNYDFPLYTADYIHRAGRTGRLGSGDDCKVTSFVSWPREIMQLQKMELSFRKMDSLPSVNANIRGIIQNRISNMITNEIKSISS